MIQLNIQGYLLAVFKTVKIYNQGKIKNNLM